jgi:hypothetical protein
MERGAQFPVIKLELERMGFAIKTALTEYSLQMTDEIQRAVDEFCTPENIRRTISGQIQQVLRQAIEEEMRGYFLYRGGRTTIREAVDAVLDKRDIDARTMEEAP